jgi:hypothetical protein
MNLVDTDKRIVEEAADVRRCPRCDAAARFVGQRTVC